MYLCTFHLLLAAAPTPVSVVIILFFVIACIIIGFISALKAFNRLKSENKELDAIRKLEGKVDENWLKTILKDAEAKLNENNLGQRLTLRRLQLIKETLYGNEGTNQAKAIQPPHMNDLHNLTEQAIMSSKPATLLRISTSVLLIIGICGTLWGVHAVIDQNSELSQMNVFAPALLPSAIAVFFTIVLLTLRGFYLMAADRFLYKLDRETMVRWLPGLIPSAGLDAEIADFAKAIHKFNADIKTNMAPLSSALTNVNDTSQKMNIVISDLNKANEQLQTQFSNAIAPACKELTQRQASIQKGLEATETTLEQIKLSLAMLQELNGNLTEEAKLYKESMNATRQLIQNNRDKLEKATSTSDELRKVVIKMNQDVLALGDLAGAASGLNSAIENTSKQMDEKSRELHKTAKNTVDWLNYAKNNLTAITEHTDKISGTAEQIKTASETATAAAGTVQQQAQNFSGKLEDYNTAIIQERSQMIRAREELEKKASNVGNLLRDIASRARALESKVISPVGFLGRFKSFSKTSEGEQPHRKRR